nr:hypothetical protein [Gemmatimonadaceae bacterium]
QELHYPDSLGLLYSAVTYHCGFRVNSGEHKLMGLAPYGSPRFLPVLLDEVVLLRDDGSFTLDQRFFDYVGGLTMTNTRFSARFGGPPRAPESPITTRELDLARSVQALCEEIVLRMARTAHRVTGLDAICIAGGVALNAVANGRLQREGLFRHVWVQPAAGDAGGALGAALLAAHRYFDAPREIAGGDTMRGARLGPSFAPDACEAELAALGAVVHRLEEAPLLDRTAALLAAGQVIGWFDGPMEFGPRALGGRSILADPRDPAMQRRLNMRIKFREDFRPFAPSVLAERASQWFDLTDDSPYMLVVSPVSQARRVTPPASAPTEGLAQLDVARSTIPAVTHVDGTARVQTVARETAPRFHALLQAFERLTGCPMLVNTSFNVRGEPIVCTPSDAYACFMRTDIDALVVYPFLVLRAEQPDDPSGWQRAGSDD